MRRFAIFVILALCALSGCVPPVHIESCAFTLQQTDVAQRVDEAFATPSFVEGELPSERWWELFGDDNLSYLIDLALSTHPDVAIAQDRIHLAEQIAYQAHSRLMPHLNFSPDVQWQKLSRNSYFFLPQFQYFTQTTLTLNFNYELDLWGKNKALFYAELDEIVARSLDTVQAQLVLAAAVAKTYFDLQRDIERLAILYKRIASHEQLYSLITRQKQSGLIGDFQVYETALKIATFKDMATALVGEIEGDRHALAYLVGNSAGCDIAALLECPSGCFNAPFPLPCTLPLDLIARRPDILAQKCRIERREFLINAAQASFYPNLDLIFSPALASTQLAKLFTAGSAAILVDAAFHLPIYEGGRLVAELGEAKEEYEIAVGTYNRLILEAVQDVSNYLTAVQIVDERLKISELALRDAAKLYDLHFILYNKGVADYLAALVAIDEVFVQEDLKVRLQHIRLTGAVGLIKALGGGYYTLCDAVEPVVCEGGICE